MAIKFTTTSKAPKYVSVLVHGQSGYGKTYLSKTCPNPLIISSEKKLITLQDENIPVVLIENYEDLEKVLNDIRSGDKKYKKFKTIVLDSISDIAETILTYFKENPIDNNNDKRAAYGSLNDVIIPLIKGFRDIEDKHVYMIAKTQRIEDQHTGIAQWEPFLPGQKLGYSLPYLFDYVFALRIDENDDGKKRRYLQTESDLQWLAKGTDKLKPVEKPHLGYIFKKILSSNKKSDDKKGDE